MPKITVIEWTPIYLPMYGDTMIVQIDGPTRGDVFVSCDQYNFDDGSQLHIHEYRRPTTIVREVERDNYVKAFGRS